MDQRRFEKCVNNIRSGFMDVGRQALFEELITDLWVELRDAENEIARMKGAMGHLYRDLSPYAAENHEIAMIVADFEELGAPGAETPGDGMGED